MRPRPPGRATTVKHEHAEWADLAYELLYRRDKHEEFDLQYAVMQGLMVAYEMGLEGKYPPRPAHLPPRRHEPKPLDPEMEAIAQELRMLAWSPLAGTERPEGHMKWALAKYVERTQAARKPPPVVARRPPAPQQAAQAPVVVRRRK